MASRLRYDGLTTTLGASLSDDGTAITFSGPLEHAGGTPVPTLAGGDYIALSILNESRQLVEIVHLTAYTEGDSDGTISRGEEGTTGASHTTGAVVLNGANVADFVSEAADIAFTPSGTLAADNVQDAINEANTEYVTGDANLLTALNAHVDDVADAHDAAAISTTGPSANVQAYLDELDSEKAKLSQITQFTGGGADQDYVIPTGAKYLLIKMAGAGGGGGGGRRGLATQICTGGGGGGGGGYTERRVRVADLGVGTLKVDVGAGGAGGTNPAGAANSTANGNDGAAGGTSNVKTAAGAASHTNCIAQATGGSGGAGGGNSGGGSGGDPGIGEFYGAPGNLANTNASGNSVDCPSGLIEKSGASRVTYFGPPGGGGGGGVAAAGTLRGGGGGGFPNGRHHTITPSTAADTVGTAGDNPPNLGAGYGGSGGGGSAAAGRNGGNGGRAAGGGGGGAFQTASGNSAGTGGNGGDGFVEIEAIF